MKEQIKNGWRPEIGQPVVGENGCLGHVVEVVDEEAAWGGPWAAKIEYYYIEEGNIFPLHEWCSAQEWGKFWRILHEEERQKCKVVVNKYGNLAVERR